MVFLRFIIFFHFFACSSLLLFQWFGSEAINNAVVFDGLFIFVYPMAYAVLLMMFVLVLIDVFRYRSTGEKKMFIWAGVDLFIPLSSYFIFEIYFRLIGQV